MPELPEVETTRRGLALHLLGKTIQSLTFMRDGLRFKFPIDLPDHAAGKKITGVNRFSKYIVLELGKNAGGILLHLGMSGRLLVQDAKSYKPAKHDHVLLQIKGGKLLVFNDARRFGVLDFIVPGQSHRLLDTLGLDPFDAELTPQWLLMQTQNKRVDMKALLMDQTVIAGLGNIYVCEALFDARIHPKRIANTLTLSEAKKLVPAIRKVLNAALDAGGSSLRDYKHASGELGFFQDKFKVYGRAGKPCVRCKNPVERIVQSGRSTFLCATCQC